MDADERRIDRAEAMNPLVEIAKALTSGWLWTVVFAITGAFMGLVKDALGKKLNRRQLSRLLRRRRYRVLYHDLLQAALARVDRWLTPRIGPSDEAREVEGQRAWSWPLFDLSLRLALAYPLLTLVIAWGVLGADGKLGSLVVLRAAEPFTRIAGMTLIALVVWLIYAVFRAAERQKLIFLALAMLLLALAAIVAPDSIIAGVRGVFFVGFFGIAAFTPITIIVALTGGKIFAVAGAATIAFAVAGALVLVYVEGVVSVEGAFAFAFAVAVVFAGVFAIAGVAAVGVTSDLTRFGLVAYIALVGVLLLAVAVCVRYSPKIIADGATLIVFLGLLPLLNAVFDFISIGLTRFLLRRGAVSVGFGALGWALGDLASALAFFALLGLALVTMVHGLNELGAAPLLDLGALFTDIRADPGAYWWLYFTIFSTLLPTLLHLVLASFSALLAVMPEGVALFIRRQLPRIEVDAMAKAAAFWTLSTIGFLAIAAVAFGLYGLVIGVLAVFPHAGEWYLWLFERYVAWL